MTRHPKDLEAALALRAGGDLPAAETARLEAHLAHCTECRSVARDLAEDRRALQDLGAAPVEEAALARVRAGVLHAIEGEARSRRASRPSGTPWLTAALAAVLVLAALGAGLWLRPPTGEEPAPADRTARWNPGAPGRGDAEADRVAGAATAVEPLERAPAVPPAETAPGETASAEAGEPGGAASPDPTRADPTPRRTAPPSEPMRIQVVSDDPEIVYYWLVEPEESEHDTLPSRSRP